MRSSPLSLPPTHPNLLHLQTTGLYNAAPNAYSHAVRVQEPVSWLFISGQGGENAQGLLPEDFAAQAEQALANVQTALAAGGASMADVIKLTVLIVDHGPQRFEQWKQSVMRHWGSGDPSDPKPRFPACTLIPVQQLALPGMLIEVEATAAIAATSVDTQPR